MFHETFNDLARRIVPPRTKRPGLASSRTAAGKALRHSLGWHSEYIAPHRVLSRLIFLLMILLLLYQYDAVALELGRDTLARGTHRIYNSQCPLQRRKYTKP